MPSKGEIKESFPPGCTPAQVQLAKALGTLRQQAGDLSLRSMELEVRYSRTSISKCLNAKQLPSVDMIERLHQLAYKYVQASGGTVSIPLPRLLDLRARAAERPCSHCPVVNEPQEQLAMPDDEPATSTEVLHIRRAAERSRKPARSQASKHRSAKELRRLLDRRRSGNGSERVTPVPLQEGDRRHDTDQQQTWDGLEEVRRHLSRGNMLDAAVLLRHHGRSLSSDDLPPAVAACRSAGFDDAAELILSAAGSRGLNTLLNLASAFNEQQRHTDLEILLRAARRATTAQRLPAAP
ncbi:hypothetical protein ACFYYR_03290 [Streptomyces sp. NPDC001922]|uniref:hypothetical protein n=1 Tax=Streptomyces sp. NPDC001922 TaxID=3364624 RepID=UPI003692B0B4